MGESSPAGAARQPVAAEREAMLRAVLADPDDDTVRLAFADWLDEHGEHDRAAFVRVEVEMAAAGPEPRRHARDCPRHGLYRTRHRTRYTDHPGCAKCRHRRLVDRDRTTARDCLYDETGRLGDWGMRPSWSRGFVSTVYCTTADFLKHGPALFGEQPVTSVRLTDKTPHHSGAACIRPSPEVPTDCWEWERESLLGPGPARLPEELFWPVLKIAAERYTGRSRNALRDSTINYAEFHTPDEANAALDRVCVAWARAEAGVAVTPAG